MSARLQKPREHLSLAVSLPGSLSLKCFSSDLFFIHTFINKYLLRLYYVHVGLSLFSLSPSIYLAPLPCPWPPPSRLAVSISPVCVPPWTGLYISPFPQVSRFSLPSFFLSASGSLFLGASLPLPDIAVDPGSARLPSRCACRSHSVSVCLAFGGALALLRRCRSINLRRRRCRREEGRDVGCANSLPPDASK